jgi:hypothetical protein
MFGWLKRLIQRLLSYWAAKPQPVEPFSPGSHSGGRGPRQPPRDPDSRVREPKPRRPSGNSAAVAVEEPDERETVTAVGASGRQRTLVNHDDMYR